MRRRVATTDGDAAATTLGAEPQATDAARYHRGMLAMESDTLRSRPLATAAVPTPPRAA